MAPFVLRVHARAQARRGNARTPGPQSSIQPYRGRRHDDRSSDGDGDGKQHRGASRERHALRRCLDPPRGDRSCIPYPNKTVAPRAGRHLRHRLGRVLRAAGNVGRRVPPQPRAGTRAHRRRGGRGTPERLHAGRVSRLRSTRPRVSTIASDTKRSGSCRTVEQEAPRAGIASSCEPTIGWTRALAK